MAWLSRRLRENDLFLLQDRKFSKLLFKEVLESYVGGQFIATIVLGFAFIERAIAARLSYVGEAGVKTMNSEELVKRAFARKWLTDDEFHEIDELRCKLRNPVVHFREHSAESRPEIQAISSAMTTEQMLEKGAKRILESAIHVLVKTAL